ncbi:TRAP transporter large permease subunit [Pseudorhodobacter aquimaris]|uniref:TRAP transporter large permease subunit n=1 Tax=Pseudorhodobacter aquimaris TaxID=687412 RepID=UPI00067CA713
MAAINYKTSFLTPPSSFALFSEGKRAPTRLGHIYRGIIPFVAIQIFGLVCMIVFPVLVLWLPQVLK